MKLTDHNKLLLAYILGLLLLIISHSGCAISKEAKDRKAERKLLRIINNNKEVGAEVTRLIYPCTTTKIDTLITTEYELLEVECPGDTTLILDTVTNEVIKTIIKPGKVIYKESPVKTITRTIKVEDSAKIYLAVAELEHTKKDRDKYKLQSKRRGELNLWLALGVIIAALFIYVLIKRK